MENTHYLETTIKSCKEESEKLPCGSTLAEHNERGTVSYAICNTIGQNPFFPHQYRQQPQDTSR